MIQLHSPVVVWALCAQHESTAVAHNENPMSTFGKGSAGRWYQNTQVILPHKVIKKISPEYEHIKRNETRSGSTMNRMIIMEAPKGYPRHMNTLNAMKQGGQVVQ